ncbi:MAG: carbohydrate ABC transporter permease [Reyranellaceae bacterium]
MRLSTKNSALGIGLIFPVLVLFFVLLAYPLMSAILLSFNRVDTMTLSSSYVGLDNYWEIFRGSEFLPALATNVAYALATLVLQVVVGVGIALLLHREFYLRSLARGLVLFPYMLSTVVAVLVWRWLFNDLYGFLNFVLLGLGIVDAPVDWLGRMPNAFVSVVLVSTWKFFPFVVIAVLARLQSIPDYLYEAATMDGASRWSLFWDITLPQLRSVLSVIILLRAIWDFKEFDMIYLLTGGGPGHGTQTLPLMLYELAFPLSQMGKASAIGVIMLLVMLLMIVPYFRFAKVGGEESGR